MIKKLAILPLIFIVAVFLSKQVYAKIWTKDLVDKVTLDSGYKFQICTIDLNYDFNSVKDAGFISAEEKNFEANPDAYPCNKQSMQDVILANITLNFSKKNWNGASAPEKLLLFQDGLYSVDAYGDFLNDESSKAPISDISPIDWFSTLPPGIRGIRGANLINTDPKALSDQKTLQNSGFVILHDPSTGKFVAALFVINNTVYKVSNIVSQVTVPATLVDYTQTTENTPSPISNVIDETQNWQTFVNNPKTFSIKYAPGWTPLENETLLRFFPPGIKIKNGLGPDNSDTPYISIGYSNFNPLDCRGDCPTYSNPVPIKVGVNSGTKYTQTEGVNGGCGCNSETIIVKNGNTYYTFGLFGNPASDPGTQPFPISKENQQIFDQILSTFKFTDANPNPSPDGKFCGGITGKACPNGYTCKLDGNYPDAGGTCVIK